jgi:hypothetical protein
MAQYMLLVRDDVAGYGKYSHDELKGLIDKMHAWMDKLRKAGVHRGGEKLEDEPGKTVRLNGDRLIVDGPYAEVKELIGGYVIVEAADYDEAVEIGKECPALHYASVLDIRQVANTCDVVLERAH